MADKVTKTVKVSESTSQEWQNYVRENAHVDSISHLIRLSVQREISGNYIRRDSIAENGSNQPNGEVLSQLRQIQTALSDVDERLAALEGIESAESGYDLRRAAFDELPSDPMVSASSDEVQIGSEILRDKLRDHAEEIGLIEERITEKGKLAEEMLDDIDTDSENIGPEVWGATPEDIAERLSASVVDVRRELERAYEETAQVQRVEDDQGQVYYWKRESGP